MKNKSPTLDTKNNPSTPVSPHTHFRAKDFTVLIDAEALKELDEDLRKKIAPYINTINKHGINFNEPEVQQLGIKMDIVHSKKNQKVKRFHIHIPHNGVTYIANWAFEKSTKSITLIEVATHENINFQKKF